MFKGISNTLQNFAFLGQRFLRSGGGGGVRQTPHRYKVSVPKDLVKEGLIEIACQLQWDSYGIDFVA